MIKKFLILFLSSVLGGILFVLFYEFVNFTYTLFAQSSNKMTVQFGLFLRFYIILVTSTIFLSNILGQIYNRFRFIIQIIFFLFLTVYVYYNIGSVYPNRSLCIILISFFVYAINYLIYTRTPSIRRQLKL